MFSFSGLSCSSPFHVQLKQNLRNYHCMRLAVNSCLISFICFQIHCFSVAFVKIQFDFSRFFKIITGSKYFGVFINLKTLIPRNVKHVSVYPQCLSDEHVHFGLNISDTIASPIPLLSTVLVNFLVFHQGHIQRMER